tara:strand:- start:18402 stop:19490 length:1089 start_codon:yes stop_codon:yes gene_type:complete
MKKLIYVLHERSTKEHFTALESYASIKNLEIKYREFLLFRHLIKSMIRLDSRLFIQQIKNVLFFIGMIFSRRKIIILGIAPLDFYLPLLIFFLKKHNLFYFTSWGDWSGNFFPKKKFSNSKFIKKTWSNFLKIHIKGVFCVTNTSAKNIQENYELTCPIVVVSHSIDNSIPINKFIINKRDTNKINLIYVGRLIENKGVRELLTLIKGLDKELFSLTVVGEGPLRKSVEEATRIFSNIEYLGYVNSKRELFDLFCKSDVQLLFSKKTKENNWEELFGMVVIEAMYCGVATISTKHVGPKSIIDNRVNGFLIDENKCVEEATKILEEKSFKNEEFIVNTQLKASQFYKDNLQKKWGEILEDYI